MQTWHIQDAKARFSEFLNTCVNNGPQLVTKRGVEAAVLVPIETWNRMQEMAKPSLKELLLSNEDRGELVLPKRGSAKRRAIKKLP
jgi:prevent-host-death family protein